MGIYSEETDPNENVPTTKDEIIEKINSIIKEYGSFTVADVEAVVAVEEAERQEEVSGMTAPCLSSLLKPHCVGTLVVIHHDDVFRVVLVLVAMALLMVLVLIFVIVLFVGVECAGRMIGRWSTRRPNLY